MLCSAYVKGDVVEYVDIFNVTHKLAFERKGESPNEFFGTTTKVIDATNALDLKRCFSASRLPI